MKNSKKSFLIDIILALTYIAIGIFIVIYPTMSINIICYITGAVALIYGGVKLLSYFKENNYGSPYQKKLFSGIIFFALGLTLLIQPNNALILLPIIMGIIILIDGLIKLANTLELKKLNLQNWWALCILAVICCILGLVLIIKPFGVADVIMQVLGITLIINGIQDFISTILTSKYKKKMEHQDDIIIVDSDEE